ncbi:MAG: hypothetical protein OXN27_17045 [Candidatus Poribacteria bacterium]|nr:hypothetical protein [Candidatus Poribacteria bacterium]
MRAPKFDADVENLRLDIQRKRAKKMEGKTVKKISFGIRTHDADVHRSDVLQVEFTDGTTLYIETATNTQNIIQSVKYGKRSSLTPPDFHADLHLTWVD